MFNRIGHKLILTFGGISTIGLIIMVLFYTDQQQQSLFRQNEQIMSKVTQSVIEGLQTVMLAGYADIAQDYAANLHNVQDVVDFRIARIDGNEAFLDNKTIENVNKRKQEELFELREEQNERRIIPVDSEDLRKAIATEEIVKIRSNDASGENFLTFIAPIKNKKECHECHGSADPVRGIVKITTSLQAVENAVDSSRWQAYQMSVPFLLLIVLLTGLMVKRTIVQPISRVTTAMTSVSRGDLSMTVPVLGRDEISIMAKSFNRMSLELKTTYEGLAEERDKLTTLILSAHDGMVVTDRNGKIVLANPSAVEILRKSSRDIFDEGFIHLFDDPEIMRRAIDEESYIEIINNERVLQILASTILNQEQETIGSAALIRDVTAEKTMQAELQHLAISDGLTGLFNRRHLDETLASELNRCRRYGHEMSIIMFDVDHFKRFNDEYGHEQGDRVLQNISSTVKGLIRSLDIPCRYGGEEFLIILPETSNKFAQEIAERLRKAVEQTDMDGLRVTISIGVASYPYCMVGNPKQFIEAADKALYEAKNAGRNCMRAA
ncbi:MAG: diguanylate cyclase [Gammaproteobacteria bacterium]|nr:diguanylate cyclase [Gammaproteobacteria bacterium]MDH3447787.1 diguanylate cyclase [Gammaproteobacteria bacterium]